jgi:uncharacterized tellurite resistance protein B-like protein
VRIALGRYVAARVPIPAAWALALVRTHPEGCLRTPATRCLDEFDLLFAVRYHARFGAGLVVRPSAARIRVSYRPASSAFDGTYEAILGDLPDVSGPDGPIAQLKDLASECSDELGAYSRHLGRFPDGQGSPAAVALLPEELLAAHGGDVVTGLRSWATARLTPPGAAGRAALVGIDEVVERWSPGRPAKLAKGDAVVLAGLLGKLGIGIEPDVRFGASTPKPGSSAILFPLPEGATAAPSASYSAAATLVHLAAVVSAADGVVDDAERRLLAEHLQEVLGLDPAERVRLEAHLSWLVAAEAGLAGLKRRVGQLDIAQRGSIGNLLVGIAAADGRVTPDEITVLTKLYRLLGLDETEVYSLVHALAGTDPGPITVREREAPADRWAVPPPSAAPAAPAAQGAVVLDPAKVQARLAETATVTALLAGIFVDDESPVAPPGEHAAVLRPEEQPPSSGPAAPAIAGLDGPHARLADRLRGRPAWSRGEAEDVAAELGLPLLDGALDRINEAAIDACGEPLAEGDDPIDLNAYAIEELFA